MVKIIANQKLPYGGKNWTEGETLDVSEKDAKFLVHIKRARLAPADIGAPAALKTMAAPANVAPEEAAPEAPAHPQTYHRRDLTAETPAGPTGPAKSPQSLRRGPARKAKT